MWKHGPLLIECAAFRLINAVASIGLEKYAVILFVLGCFQIYSLKLTVFLKFSQKAVSFSHS